jgi:two-component system response regulator MprA
VTSTDRLLLLDADPARAILLHKHLQAKGYHLSHCTDISQLTQPLALADLQLLLLQAEDPADAAEGLCRKLRQQGCSLPILMLTPPAHFSTRVSALRAGADDVLSQPFALEELTARVQALLRRSRMGGMEAAGSVLRYADLVVHTDTRRVVRAGQPLKLTVKEYDLLLCLLRHAQQVLSRQRILHLVWGDTWVGDDNLLDVYIRYLRKKIERSDLQPLIHTVRGVGFVLR